MDGQTKRRTDGGNCITWLANAVSNHWTLFMCKGVLRNVFLQDCSDARSVYGHCSVVTANIFSAVKWMTKTIASLCKYFPIFRNWELKGGSHYAQTRTCLRVVWTALESCLAICFIQFLRSPRWLSADISRNSVTTRLKRSDEIFSDIVTAN